MTYIVVYQRKDGSSGLEECADLDLAIVTAERLRNVDSVERPRIFETSEITYDFKPYYRVEVTSADATADATADAPAAADEAKTSGGTTTTSAATAAPVVDVAVASVDGEDAQENETVDVEQDAISSLAKKAEAAAAKADSISDVQGPADVEPAEPTSGSGLFSDRGKAEDNTAFPAVTKEDTPPDASPRRGLFGR